MQFQQVSPLPCEALPPSLEKRLQELKSLNPSVLKQKLAAWGKNAESRQSTLVAASVDIDNLRLLERQQSNKTSGAATA